MKEELQVSSYKLQVAFFTFVHEAYMNRKTMNKTFRIVACSLKLIACVFLLLAACSLKLEAQNYWQQAVRYNINVALNDTNHSLTGSETIQYSNHSPDTLSYIWFHIWPNAYKDNTTALYKQLSQLEERRDKLKKIKENGYIDHLAFTVNGMAAATAPHPLYNDVIRLLLPSKLPPGGEITIATPFFVKNTIPIFPAWATKDRAI